jgi:ParB family chromosome partitioning protein
MQVLKVNPKECVRWEFADRSTFEFGDVNALAEDIKKNGQIEPVLIRQSKKHGYKYEIIAGSRRWKACLELDLPLNAILTDMSDEEAAIAQIKENQNLPICDYSKGMYYSRLLDSKKMTQVKLAENVGCSRAKLYNYLTFNQAPKAVWQAVQNMSKVSSKTSAAIYALSQKGESYINAIIELAEEIRKGVGAERLEAMVYDAMNGGTDKNLNDQDAIISNSGQVIGVWKNNSIKFSKNIKLDQKKLEAYLIKYFH